MMIEDARRADGGGRGDGGRGGGQACFNCGQTGHQVRECPEPRRAAGGGGRGISALVLAPTRELAIQIKDEAVKFGRSGGINSVVL